MASTISTSLIGVRGPRFAGITVATGAGASARYSDDRGTR